MWLPQDYDGAQLPFPLYQASEMASMSTRKEPRVYTGISTVTSRIKQHRRLEA